MQGIELGIDTHPKHLCIFGFIRQFQQVQRFLNAAQGAMDQRQMIGRDIPPSTELIHLLNHCFGARHITRFSFSRAQSSQRKTAFPHHLNASRRGCNCLIVAAHPAQEKTRAMKHRQIVWFRLDGLPCQLIGLIETPSVVRTPDERETGNNSQRIQISSELRLVQRLGEATFHRQLQRVQNSRDRVIRIEFNRVEKLSFSAGPGEVAAEHSLAQRSMSFRQQRIDRHGGRCSFIGCGRAFGKWHNGKRPEPIVIRRQSGISNSVVWIERDGLVVTYNCSRKTIFVEGIPIKAAAKVGFVSLWIIGAALRQTDTLLTG